MLAECKKQDFRLSDPDKALKTGTVPAKTGRVASMCSSVYNCCTDLEDKPQNRISYKYLAMETDRYPVLDGAAAAIAPAALKAHGIITTKENTYVIDGSKLRRERTKEITRRRSNVWIG